MAQIGIPGLIIILFMVLVIFGPKKLPQLARAIGETFSEFRNSTKQVLEEPNDENEKK